MLLNPSPIRSDRFTFVGAESLLVAEASDLGPDFRLARVYDDACDVGFTVVSATTGKGRVFYAGREVRDAEGELLYEEFEMTPESARHQQIDYGAPGTLRVRIYND